MISFESDYIQGAHPLILKRLCETNLEPLSGYGNDPYCESAKEKIRAVCEAPAADVFFLVGGTQTNQVVISAMLRPYEGVIAATSGHIEAHEAGAIEATGHKVLTVPHRDGKIAAEDLRMYLEGFYADSSCDHMVFPGMVYISQSTEYGTVYTRQELTELSEVCRQYSLPLFIDGARLGYALTCSGGDLTMADIARLCDVFYIGGTKVGALCGEAVVFPRGNAPAHMFTMIKQRGALLAKGRLLGVQFDTLFTDDLYFEISRHANALAQRLRSALVAKGYSFFIENDTNQIFIPIENDKLQILARSVKFTPWEPRDEHHTVVRFVTSWATTEDEVEQLIALL